MKSVKQINQTVELERITQHLLNLNKLGTAKAQHDYNLKVMKGEVKA